MSGSDANRSFPEMGGRSPYGAALALGLLAALLRGAFVCWAPGGLSGDAFWYDDAARSILLTGSYRGPDGSPAIIWLPGWPATVAAIYAVFGSAPRSAMLANAAFGGLTVGLLVYLGSRLFDRRVGIVAGVLYTLWPASIYFTAALMSETLFNLLLVAFLALLATGAMARAGRQTLCFAAAGLLLGLQGLVKGEALALLPMLLLLLWTVRQSHGKFFAHAVIAGAIMAAILLPWAYRNYLHFGRFMLSANGGYVAWLGNHPGAKGGNDVEAGKAFLELHEGPNFALRVIEANDQGWREAFAFVRSMPGEWFEIVGRKLALTYGSDGEGAYHVRGFGPGVEHRVESTTVSAMLSLADGYWFAILLLAALGLLRVGSWRAEAYVLVLGPIATWFLVHVAFLGGARFHVPEYPGYALLAAQGIGLLSKGMESAASSARVAWQGRRRRN